MCIDLSTGYGFAPRRKFYVDAVEVGCSRCVDMVLLELSDELVTPSCTELSEVKVRYSL
jgi:hypothetical protein